MQIERLEALFYYNEGNLYNAVSRGSAKKDMLTGYITEDGYRRVRVDGQYIYVHQVVWILHEGEIPEGLFIDHIDGDRLNNARYNLRLATPRENQQNKARQQNGTSKYKGVWYDAKKAVWKASIRIEKARYYIGQFRTEEEAAIAYDGIAIEIHGKFAKLNLPGRISASL
jgi:hypothetical protein